MKKLSTGMDSTLGNWLALTEVTMGKDSSPAKFLRDKIDQSPNGENEEVIVDEGQLLFMLGNMLANDLNGNQ